jgi:tripartite-type tricarboxylate transporter receptor subunit TctC
MQRNAPSFIALILFTLCALVGATSTTAQPADWPNKPIRFMVPFPPGGTIDPLGRLIANRLKQDKGWNVFVENRAGASGSIGTGIAAKSAPDGYTFVLVFDTHAVNPSLIPSLPFDTRKDLDAVMVIGTSAMVLSTHESRPYRSIDDLLKSFRAKPDGVTYGTIGNGSLAHLTMKQLERLGQFTVTHVPYKGGGPLLADATGGTLDSFMTSVAAQIPHIRSGRMRPLAVTGEKRAKQLPDVPTLSESGFPGYSAKTWWGLLAPAKTPRAIIDSMNREVRRILEDTAIRLQLEETLAMEIWASSPDEMRAFVDSEIERWARVVKDNNIKSD